MIYCGTRFDDLYLCEREAGHKGDHALRPRCVYCDDPLLDDEVSYHFNGVCDKEAADEARDMLAQEVAATVRRIEFLDAATTAGTVGDEPVDEFDYVDVLLYEALQVVGVWRGSDRETAQLDAIELLMCDARPTVHVTVDDGGFVTVRGTWGDSEVERVTWAGMLAERLFKRLGGDTDEREVQL